MAASLDSSLLRTQTASALSAEFQRCLAEQKLVDAQIFGGAGGDLMQSVRCHRLLLAAVSGFLLSALLTVEDEDEVAIVIPDMTVDELTSVVECVYYPPAADALDPGVAAWLVALGICTKDALLSDAPRADDGEDVADDVPPDEIRIIVPPAAQSDEPPKFVCNHDGKCEKSFPSRHRVELHRKQAHGVRIVSSDLTCSVCLAYRAKTREALETHVRSQHNGERPFRCLVCEKSFAAQSYLDQHADVHNTEKVHKCPECPRRFQSLPSLSQHKTTHLGRRFKCEACDIPFLSKRYLRQHVANKHSGGGGGGGRESEAANPGGRHECHVCGKILSRKYELQCHLRTHTLEKPYSCPSCTFMCRNRSTLANHTRYVHSASAKSEAKFVCEFCERRFLQNADLRKHLRTHTLERPFKCGECGKAFAREDYQKKHLKMHLRKQAKQAAMGATPAAGVAAGTAAEEIVGDVALLGDDILGETVELGALGSQGPIELVLDQGGGPLPAEDGEDQEEKRRAIYLISHQT